ncbi:hypothetical protein QL285_018753 [Trifolium repens]|nr:hypothetical protein QL285_018753 [Trifolium repens]
MRNLNRFKTITQGRREPHCGANGGGRGSPPHDSNNSGSSHTPPPRHGNMEDPTKNCHRRRQDSVLPARRHTRHHRGPFARQIMESVIPRALEKPQNLKLYDGTRPPTRMSST